MFDRKLAQIDMVTFVCACDLKTLQIDADNQLDIIAFTHRLMKI